MGGSEFRHRRAARFRWGAALGLRAGRVTPGYPISGLRPPADGMPDSSPRAGLWRPSGVRPDLERPCPRWSSPATLNDRPAIHRRERGQPFEWVFWSGPGQCRPRGWLPGGAAPHWLTPEVNGVLAKHRCASPGAPDFPVDTLPNPSGGRLPAPRARQTPVRAGGCRIGRHR